MDHDPAKSSQVPLDRQISLLSQLSDQIQDSLAKDNLNDLEPILEDLAQLSNSLANSSQQVARLEEEHKNYLALANINQLLNSSLQVNDVLRVVMDTIVRLTGAERGFLMLKDDQQQLAIHIARNWERRAVVRADGVLGAEAAAGAVRSAP